MTTTDTQQVEAIDKINKIRRRALIDGYRSLTLKDGTASLALVQARADVLEILDLFDARAAVTGPRGDVEKIAKQLVIEFGYTPTSEWQSKIVAAFSPQVERLSAQLEGMMNCLSASQQEGTCAKCGGSGEIVIGCAVGHPLTAPCPECSAKRAQTAGEQDASRWVKNKLRPEHKCKPLARAVMMEGRDWWIGELLEPVADWPNETHCLHMKTPLKDVSFLCNAGDFEQLMVLCNVLVKLENLTWLRATTAGAKARLRPPFTETEGDHR